MARPKKIELEEKIIEEAFAEALEAQVEVIENKELKELQSLHKSMTEKGIKDIGQLEVLISRFQ